MDSLSTRSGFDWCGRLRAGVAAVTGRRMRRCLRRVVGVSIVVAGMLVMIGRVVCRMAGHG